MKWFIHGFAVLAISAVCAPDLASAQTSNRGTTSAPRPQLGPTDFLKAALHVVAMVDRYEMAQIWDSASPIMQASISKDRFVANTAQQRAKLGGISSRDWSAIMRVVVDDQKGALPPGRYMTVRFTTRGKSGLTMTEVISFHLADDGNWKLAGYSIS